MSQNRFRSRVVWCVATLFGMAVRPALAEMTVTLADGRQIQVDAIGLDSNASLAALQRKKTGIELTRWLPWERIAAVTIEGKTYSGAELREAVLARGVERGESRGAGFQPARDGQVENLPHEQMPFVSDGPLLPMPVPVPLGFPCDDGLCGRGVVIGVRDDPLSAYADLERRYFPQGVPLSERGFALDLLRAAKARAVVPPLFFGPPLMNSPPPFMNSPSPVVPLAPGPRPAEARLFRKTGFLHSPLSAIQATATPINAEGKVDWDSLLVNLSAVDHAGRPVPIDPASTLRVTLWGQKQRVSRAFGNLFFSKPGRIEQVASWSVGVNDDARQTVPPSFAPQNVVAARSVILPLPHPLPEHDLNRFPIAELHVELIVPGQGIFETTQPEILLKHVNPLREKLLVETGSPFFPQEATTGSRRFTGPRFEASSLSGPNSRIFSVQP